MGKYFVEQETVKVEFPDGEWITIKEELSQADQDAITRDMVKVSGQIDTEAKDGTKPKADMKLELGQLPLMERAVVDWSFKDDAGAKIPVNNVNLSNLRLKYRKKLLEEIDRLQTAAYEFIIKN